MNSIFVNIINRGNFVVLDTETTGLNKPAEICQIAVINPDGTPLINSLVKTRDSIPADATAIHGITDQKVSRSPTWPDLRPTVLAEIKGKDVIVYNAKYDRHMMHCSDEKWGIEKFDYHAGQTWYCAMEWYAEIWGDWNDYHRSYRWQKLSSAVEQQGLTAVDAHDALGDCLMTLALIRKVCSQGSAR